MAEILSFVFSLLSIGYIGYIAIIVVICLFYLLVESWSVIVSCIKFPWTVITSFLRIRQINNLSVLQVDNIDKVYYKESEVFPLDKMVILRKIDLRQYHRNWYISILLPSIQSNGRLRFNVYEIYMGEYYFLTKLLLEITGFNNNYKKVFQLDYRYDSVHSSSVINSCRIPKINQLNSLDKLRHKASIQVAGLIYENILLQQEIVKINKQHDEIDKVFKLIAKSEQYVNQQEIYKNALLDLNKVLSKADELNNVTFDYISEILINTKLKTNEISVFSNNVTDKYLSIEAQHLQLKEDYQHLKDVSSNYDSLVKINK